MSDCGVNLPRDLILLNDEDRFVRKNALKSLKSDLVVIKYPADFGEKLSRAYGTYLSNALNDDIESNRELAIEVISLYINAVNDVSSILPTLMDIIVQRLGQKNIIEPSEEIRLSLLKILYDVLKKIDKFSEYVDSCVEILNRTFADPFPEIKKISCQIAELLALKKYQRFYEAAEIMLNSLLLNLTHQHSKVRNETVKVLSVIMLHSQGKLVENTIAPLTQRLFDSATNVRRSAIELFGNWLLNLPDRYSYQTKLIPLLLSGLSDESDEIRSITHDLWDQIGCRELIYRSASKLIPAICRDLSDWQDATRTKAASLLPIIILHLEESTTQHTQHLINGITNGLIDSINCIASSNDSTKLLTHLFSPMEFCSNTDISTHTLSIQNGLDQYYFSGTATDALKVANQLLISAQLIGCMTAAKFWWHLLEPCLNRCTESYAPSSLASYLFLLAGLIHGSPLNQLVLLLSDNTNQTTATTGDGSSCGSGSGGSPFCQIINYLGQPDILSVSSIAAKAGLYQSVQIVLNQFSYYLNLLRRFTFSNVSVSDHSAQESNTEVAQSDLIVARYMAQLDVCPVLFRILLALNSVWFEPEMKSTQFGQFLAERIEQHSQQQLIYIRRQQKQHRIDQEDRLLVLSEITSQSDDSNQIYTDFISKLFDWLDADLNHSGSWHSRSVGLFLFQYALEVTSPSLFRPNSTEQLNYQLLLDRILKLLERGCRLNSKPPSNKSPGVQQDFLTNSGEIELRSRGLFILTKLMDLHSIRNFIASSSLFMNRLLTEIILPVCMWQSHRVAEAMRKAAVTCLFALLAATTIAKEKSDSHNNDDDNNSNNNSIINNLAQTEYELKLDSWLINHVKPVKVLMESGQLNYLTYSSSGDRDDGTIDRTDHNNREDVSSPSFYRLDSLPVSCLSLLLTRILSLLDDDLESTRRLACICLILLINNLYLCNHNPAPIQYSLMEEKTQGLLDSEQQHQLVCLFQSPCWWWSGHCKSNSNSNENNSSSLTTPPLTSVPDRTDPVPNYPMPNSFGDQMSRIYPNLVKRLNDSKDHIRLLVSEAINCWLRLMIPIYTRLDLENSGKPLLSPTYSAVISSLIESVIVYLDDQNECIRAGTARTVARLAYIAPDMMKDYLRKAKESHRCTYLCDQLLLLIDQVIMV